MNALLLLPVALTLAQEPSRTVHAEKIKAVRVEASAGEVQVVSDREGAQVAVETLGNDPDKACKFSLGEPKGEMVVRSENKPGQRKSCKVGWRVIAPETVDVRAASGSGAVSVRGFSRAVSAKTGSGAISLESLRGAVEAKTGSGEIKGVGLSGDVVARTGSGNISLAFANAPKKVSASTGSGDVEIGLPKGSTVSRLVKTGSGKTKSDFADDKAGRTKVDVKTGSGNVSLLEGQ